MISIWGTGVLQQSCRFGGFCDHPYPKTSTPWPPRSNPQNNLASTTLERSQICQNNGPIRYSTPKPNLKMAFLTWQISSGYLLTKLTKNSATSLKLGRMTKGGAPLAGFKGGSAHFRESSLACSVNQTLKTRGKLLSTFSKLKFEF